MLPTPSFASATHTTCYQPTCGIPTASVMEHFWITFLCCNLKCSTSNSLWQLYRTYRFSAWLAIRFMISQSILSLRSSTLCRSQIKSWICWHLDPMQTATSKSTALSTSLLRIARSVLRRDHRTLTKWFSSISTLKPQEFAIITSAMGKSLLWLRSIRQH